MMSTRKTREEGVRCSLEGMMNYVKQCFGEKFSIDEEKQRDPV